MRRRYDARSTGKALRACHFSRCRRNASPSPVDVINVLGRITFWASSIATPRDSSCSAVRATKKTYLHSGVTRFRRLGDGLSVISIRKGTKLIISVTRIQDLKCCVLPIFSPVNWISSRVFDYTKWKICIRNTENRYFRRSMVTALR